VSLHCRWSIKRRGGNVERHDEAAPRHLGLPDVPWCALVDHEHVAASARLHAWHAIADGGEVTRGLNRS